MKYTIFYSWQSDTESKFNWTLIRDCINSAIKNIENKGQLKGILFNNLQESTSNIPGSPDTVQTIEERINNCQIFIGDLTITNSHPKILEFLKDNSDVPYKFSPNSNVYGEYNWAFSKHGSTAIIAVMNTFYGDPKKNPQILPFDIRQKRFPFSYSCGLEEEIKEASSNLTAFFETAIRESILKIIEEEKFRYLPFITFAEHKNEFLQKCEYCSNKTLEDFKKNILRDNKNIRILGISGIGKTRLIIESIKEAEEFKARYLYCDCFENDDFAKIQEKLELILKLKDNSIIVLDNCDYPKAQRIILLKRRYLSSNCKIITIWNQDDKNISDDYAYINLNVDLHDVVDEIIDKKAIAISDENKKLIKEFSDGIPLMAILLVESLNEGKTDVGKLSNKDFVNKLIFEELEEREILKSCSLFRYIGYDGDYRSQIKFIVENNQITPISGDPEVKMVLFDKLFNKYKKRSIIETNGRLFAIRPRPLAFALAEEWFDDCSVQRTESVIKLIQDKDNPNNKILTESLCSQIKYLGNNEKVQLLIEKLVDFNGPFDNAEVVNTELGSRLFRSFVEVNPTAVANNLYRLFGSCTTEELKNIEEGRRNLVWTLEKLCFDKDTFEKGTKLMMSFAVAENETWGNNSTNEFLHLFKIHLPGTQANFDERIEIIKWGLNKGGEFIKLSLKALGSALESQHFSRMSGAEMQGTKKLIDYIPTNSDIKKYWTEVLDLLDMYAGNETQYNEFSNELIAQKTRGLIRAGSTNIILPVIEKIAKRINYDWDIMLERLCDVREYDFQHIHPKFHDKINKLIEQLTKQDFYSRFVRGGKLGRNLKIDFKESDRIRQQEYLKLADEFVSNEFCSKEILSLIYKNKQLFTYPFGVRIAELIEGDSQKLSDFVEISLDILSTIEFESRNSLIFIEFCRGIKNEKTQGLITDSLLLRKELSYLLFPIFGFFGSDFDNLNVLFSLVDNELVSVEEFVQYLRYFSLPNFSEIKFQGFCKKIIEYGNQGKMTALSMLHDKLHFDKKIAPDSILFSFLEELLKSIEITNYNILNNRDYFQMVETILTRTKSPNFAKFMNQQVIKLAKDPSVSFSFDYNLKNLYNILIVNYFNEIWQDLSDALLADKEDYMIYYQLKNLLGSHIGDSHNQIGILFFGNIDKIFDWCKENQLEAPARLALMVPIYEGDEIHSITKRLIDEFGDKPYVLENLASNMGTFSWVGSTIPLLNRKRKIFESLIKHENNFVSEWAERYLKYTDQEILREIQREEEQKYLYS